MLLPEALKLHDKEKFEFHYLYFLPWKDQMAEAIRQQGGMVTCLHADNNFQIMLKGNAVSRYVKKHRIQLIHCHLPWAGIIGRLVHRSTGVPMIYTEHNKQERYHRLTRWMNRLTFNWQTSVIAVSGDVSASIKKNINPVIPVVEIPNGVNTDYFIRDQAVGSRLKQELGIPPGAVVIGTMAVFRFQKRLKEWLEVFGKASVQNPNLYAIMVGDGPLRNEIEQHRKKLGLEEKVLMPGLQTDVKPWYSAIDIFMMTSVFEGLPVALLEAMSMECAIATTDAGGIKEVILPANGYMVPVNRLDDLVVQVGQLATRESIRKKLGVMARRRVEQSFSMQSMVGKLERLYLEVMAGPINR